jgi:hypothetical protein
MFLPPEGSFDDGCLRRYLENVRNYEEEDENSNMTLANRLRLAFKDMEPDTICGKFPSAELPQLIKKRGNLGKLVVIYKPLPKLLESLVKHGLIKQ